MNGTIEITETAIEIDGRPTQLISGAIHYFRIHPALWRDRLEKAVRMGLNCIETYCCWNLHEPHPGKFDFSGILDCERFLQTAQELGLHAIVRPGPYICAEWTNGGIPPWVMALPGCRLRCSNKVYLDAVKKWFDVLLPKLHRLQYTEGGPVLLMTAENEYGSFGRDSEYIRALWRMFLDHGFDIPIVTADGGSLDCLLGGTVEELPVTLTFGCGNELDHFAVKRQLIPSGPDFCMEYWCGDFDHWQYPHRHADTRKVTEGLDRMLGAGASVNLYMFHGGTNFGFNNGANQGAYLYLNYRADTTGYDYDAPLSECGDPTEKFFALQNVIRKYRPDAAFGTPCPVRKAAYGQVKLTEFAPLAEHLEELSSVHESAELESMESFGQNQGFLFCRTELRGPATNPPAVLRFYGLRDRVQAWLDDRYLGAVFREDGDMSLPLEFETRSATLSLLVENTGHINFGPSFGRDFKGILGGVTVNYQYQDNFRIYPLPLDNVDALTFAPFRTVAENRPTFYRGRFTVKDPADTFLRFPGERGVVWINGFNLGRYWNVGPGSTLYVPGPVLKDGENEVLVFELHKLDHEFVEFIDRPLYS